MIDQNALDRLWHDTGLAEVIGFRTEPQIIASRLVDEMLSICPDCGRTLDAFGFCLDTDPDDAVRGISFCGKNCSKALDHPDCCSCERCINTRKLLY
jgi:hypothetical protein